MLKVLCGQIVSAWEWYHWIGLEENINCNKFLIFHFSLEYLKRLQRSELIHTKKNPTSCLFGSRFVKNYFLSIGWRTFICWKNPPKGYSILVWIAGCWNSSNILLTGHNPKNNCRLSGIFGAWFAFCAQTNCDPNKQEVRFIFVWSSSELWSLFKKLKNEIKK